MGCVSSTPVKDHNRDQALGKSQESYKDDNKKKLPPNVEAALQGATKRGVSFAGDVRDTPSRKKDVDDDTDSPSRAVSISGRPR